jgi:hypothetical protein
MIPLSPCHRAKAGCNGTGLLEFKLPSNVMLCLELGVCQGIVPSNQPAECYHGMELR